MVSPDRIRAMEEAIEARSLKKVQLFLKAGVPADHVYAPSHGWTFANLAARVGDAAIFHCLIDAGADITFNGGFLGSMIGHAVCTHHSSPEIVDRILADGACQQDDLNSTLLYSPEYASPENVAKLLTAGADPLYANEDGATALMHAVMHSQSEIAGLLVSAGAASDIRIPYEEHYKKPLTKLAEQHGMSAIFNRSSHQPDLGDDLTPFRSVQQAVSSIRDWFNQNASDVQLPGGTSGIQLPDAFSNSDFEDDIRELYATCDGSNDEGILPTPADNDTSYCLLPFVEALADRDMLMESNAEFEAEGTSDSWLSTWLPIASNGAGDYFAWDAATGNVFQFSHETRTAPLRATSLLELFQDIAHGLHVGKYTYSDSRGIA